MRLIIFLLLSFTASAQISIGVGGFKTTAPTPPSASNVIYVDQSNSGSEDGTSAHPWNTIQEGASLAGSGYIVEIRSGTYRETVTPANNGVIFRAAAGATVTIDGTDLISNGSWSVHSGSIYKVTTSLPNATNFKEDVDGTTGDIMANQVFKDGEMQIQARWPDISSPGDYLDLNTWRLRSSTSTFNCTTLTDTGIPAGATSGIIVMNGWFLTQTRAFTKSSNTLTYSTVICTEGGCAASNGDDWRRHYYITNNLALLNSDKEWQYESGVLYFQQSGGGSPTGVSVKKRNYGFDLRGRSSITIKGISFVGCDPVTTNTSSTNTTVDNIRGKYINHSVIQSDAGSNYTRSAVQAGIKLLGPGSIIKNSEIQYAGAHGIWLGADCTADNNLLTDIAYDGMWGSAFKPWQSSDRIIVTYNTVIRTGRGAIELHNGGGNNTDMNISYNDFSYFNMLSTDGGAIYSGDRTDLRGTRIHHNWFHDTGVKRLVTIGGFTNCGVQVTGVYFDQGSGPSTIDHNVHWAGDECDYYAEIINGYVPSRDNSQSANGGPSKLYNNTYAGTDRNYITYAHSENPDKQRNNIYMGNVVTASPPGSDVTNTYSRGGTAVNTFVAATFVGGTIGADKGLYYRPKSGSAVINAGATLGSPFDDGATGAPDIGAYELSGTGGASNWTAGYNSVLYTP